MDSLFEKTEKLLNNKHEEKDRVNKLFEILKSDLDVEEFLELARLMIKALEIQVQNFFTTQSTDNGLL